MAMFGIGPADIRAALSWLWRFRYGVLSIPQRTLFLRFTRRALRSTLLTDYLAHRYPRRPLLTVDGWTYPVVVFPLSDTLSFSEDKPNWLVLRKAWKPTHAINSRSFYWLMRSKIGSENRASFVMENLAIEPDLRMTCGITDYFSSLRTAFALEWELLRVIGRFDDGGESAHGQISEQLRLRNALEQVVTDPVTDGSGRAAAVAVSVLLAYRLDGSVRAMLRRRGSLSIEVHRGKWHVVPAGMFQAPFKDYEAEFSVVHCVLWEFLEELFSVPDPTQRRTDAKWFYSEGPVAELREMIAKGSAHLWLTGIAVDMLNLRPEILMTLFIDDAAWFVRHQTGQDGRQLFRFNTEFVESQQLPVGEVPLLQLPVGGSTSDIFQEHQLSPSAIVAPAAACLYLGHERLKQELIQ